MPSMSRHGVQGGTLRALRGAHARVRPAPAAPPQSSVHGERFALFSLHADVSAPTIQRVRGALRGGRARMPLSKAQSAPAVRAARIALCVGGAAGTAAAVGRERFALCSRHAHGSAPPGKGCDGPWALFRVGSTRACPPGCAIPHHGHEGRYSRSVGGTHAPALPRHSERGEALRAASHGHGAQRLTAPVQGALVHARLTARARARHAPPPWCGRAPCLADCARMCVLPGPGLPARKLC